MLVRCRCVPVRGGAVFVRRHGMRFSFRMIALVVVVGGLKMMVGRGRMRRRRGVVVGAGGMFCSSHLSSPKVARRIQTARHSIVQRYL